MRKTLIRTLTFVFGLYFILEFLLPKEIGGNFDKTALRAPAVLYDAESGEYRMYYVGLYNRRTQAVGLATSKDGVSWEKYEGNPVIRSTLFNSADRRGFSSLCPIKIDGGYELYYLGHDMNVPPHKTICWATSGDGFAWEKHGRLEVKGEIPWRQHDELDASAVRRTPRYTKLQALAVMVSDGKRVLFIAHTNARGRTELLRAKRTGTNGEWVVLPEPLPLTGLSATQKITSLTYVEQGDAGELWMYLSDKKLCRARLSDTMAVEFVLGTPPELEAPEEEALEEGEKEPWRGFFRRMWATAQPPWEYEEPVLAEPWRAFFARMWARAQPPWEYEAPVLPEPWRAFFARMWATAQPPWEYEEPVPPEPWRGFFARLWATAQPPWEYEEPDPLQSMDEICVFAGAEGYRLVYSRERGEKTAEDEMAPMTLYTIGSANGTTWQLPTQWAYGGESPIAPALVRGPRSQPTYLSHGFGFMGTVLSVIGAFAIGLGGVNMAIMQGRRVAKGGKGVHNSILFFICLVFMFTTTEQEARDNVEEIRQEHSWFKFQLAQAYDFVFYHVQLHLGATLFALVSFYMVGAAFRSFRVKSAEAGFLILSATIVLLGQIPLGAQLGPWLPKLGGKLLILFNGAAYRAVLMGMAIAAISVSVRLWLGLEKGMFHGT